MKLFDIVKKLSLNVETVNDIEIIGLNTLKDASNNEISFLENKKYVSQLSNTSAAAVFITDEYKDFVPENTIALVCNMPYVELAKCSKFFAPKVMETNGKEAKIGENTVIANNVTIGFNVVIGKDCTIMAGSSIGDNVTIEDNTIVYPNVVIYRDCIVGSDVIIHAGAIIGSDGFGFATNKAGEHIKIYQNGNVVIGSNVEIGANCTIDRAAFKSTIIEDMVRLDNLVHIAHNCIIGYGSILAGQTGLSGSSELGKYVVMAGQTATTGHLKIAPFTTIMGRGVVTKSIVKSNKQWAGFPLIEHRAWLKLQGKISKLLKG